MNNRCAFCFNYILIRRATTFKTLEPVRVKRKKKKAADKEKNIPERLYQSLLTRVAFSSQVLLKT